MKKDKGLFIVLDGIDGAGKATQTALLLEKLKAKGYKTGTIDFPRYYDNFFGKLVGRHLSGEFGNSDPHLASVLYALDRWESKEKIEKEIKAGKIFVCNRYMSANMIHQGGRVQDAKARIKMIKWLEEMEFDVFKIPKPDLVIYLDVLPEIGQKLVDKKSSRAYTKGKKRDIYEEDKQHLIDARNQALRLVKSKKEWKKINCMKRGEMQNPEIIGEIVWKKVEKFL
ncbi:MAG: dTMP kinase [Candidatus Paceibacterota bacterium]